MIRLLDAAHQHHLKQASQLAAGEKPIPNGEMLGRTPARCRPR
jgi:hypothetical protein